MYNEDVKKQIRKLALQGLTLTDYGWADVENGLIEKLFFAYITNKGEKGVINLGDTPVDMYRDIDDLVVDTCGNLYIFEAGGIEDYFNDFLEDDPTITLSSIPPIKTTFDWFDFYHELLGYYQD